MTRTFTAICFLNTAFAFAAEEAPVFRAGPVPAEMVAIMQGTTWHQGCPVGPQDLRRLTLTYLDFQSQPQTGYIIVHREIAAEAVSLFRRLYRTGFQIERMSPIENYKGDDDTSMAANNTSAFNCRDTTGRPGVFSNHSWGRAIDINPLTNPYVKGDKVLPPAGRAYLDRSKNPPGLIPDGGAVVKLFEKAGWTWGGRWKDRQDYQHFEKPSRKQVP